MPVNQRIQRRPSGSGPAGVLTSLERGIRDDAPEADPPAAFQSILFKKSDDWNDEGPHPSPEFLVDLNLDPLIDAITSGKQGYDLKPFYFAPLRDVDAILWRQEIMRDLENAHLFGCIAVFAQAMRAMRECLMRVEKLRVPRQKHRWFLDAVDIYCDAVMRLANDLSSAVPNSRGLRAFVEYLTGYAASERFVSLRGRTRQFVADLSAVRYTVRIDGLRIEVRSYGGQRDYSAEIEAVFERFRRESAKEYAFSFVDVADMNPVEARILDLVGQSFPELFASLAVFFTERQDYQDPVIRRFDREIQFYVAYLEHIERIKKAGLRFCYPCVVERRKEIFSDQGFDLALATRLVAERGAVVCNDFHLEGPERMIVVSGPNQGGKTTFARAFGQLHYLAALGCPVPGTRAQLYLYDRLFTHFEKGENIRDLRGKLQDDLVRVHRILARATPDSIVILNEMFTSTTLQDAIALSRKIAEKLAALDLLCVWVTFIDELAALGEHAVSMVSTVIPEYPAQRTYKIVREPADGLAYAMSIAEKYRLTYAEIRKRIGS
jgi:DNA mismatch repair protein MutS